MFELIKKFMNALGKDKKAHILKCVEDGDDDDREVKLFIASVCEHLKINRFDTGIQKIIRNNISKLSTHKPVVTKVKVATTKPKPKTIPHTATTSTDKIHNKSFDDSGTRKSFFNL